MGGAGAGEGGGDKPMQEGIAASMACFQLLLKFVSDTYIFIVCTICCVSPPLPLPLAPPLPPVNAQKENERKL